ncbi:AI-2E family transporter [Arthrobacter agilis]|uniref:AI-2E family transporter n=1 Tax=Arthrobacter agilis TaxID=37921 RepID=UPI00308255C5
MSSSSSPGTRSRPSPQHDRQPDAWAGPLGRTAHKAAQVLLLLALFTVVVYALLQVRLVIIPVLLALILASAIGPLVSWLRRKGLPSALATAVSFVALLALLGALVTGVVFAVMGQTDTLVASAVEGVDQLVQFVRNGPLPIDDGQLQAARDAVVDFATSSAAGTTALAGLSAATNFLTGLVLLVVILFFFLKDGEQIWAFILRAFTGQRLVKARRVGDQTVAVLGGYVRGTAIVAAVDAFFIGLALVILGVPLALPLAAVVFIGAFIPIVGATLAGAVATLVALVTNGPGTALIVLVVVILVNQLEGNLLQPVVMGHTLSVHPLVILVALTAGTILAGIIGAILAVPLTAVAWAGIKAWNADGGRNTADDPVADAETRTLMDEHGHGASSTPGSDAPDEGIRDAVRSNLQTLENREPVASRQDTLDARGSEENGGSTPEHEADGGSDR